MAVELNVRTQLGKIVEELDAITQKARAVGEGLKEGTKDVSDSLNNQAKQTETFLSRLASLGGRMADQLRGDFKSLLSLNALTESMKLSEQFKGSIRDAFSLTEAIRKLGPTLGIVSGDFVRFQSQMMKGLGEIGLSSEAAANALGGLSQTPVRGEKNLVEYSKTAGQLASVSREQGREGDIAKGIAEVLVAQGKNPNDTASMAKIAEDVLRVRNATGQGAVEALGALKGLYSSTNKDFLPTVQRGGAVSLASAGLLGGEGATSFLQRYLGMDRIQRMALEAQGFGKLIGPNGALNSNAVQSTLAEARGRGLGDAQAGLKTFGFSDEEAKGFIRLGSALKDNADAIERARTQVVDLNQTYRDSMGVGEAFRANLNRVKGLLATPLGFIGNKGASALEKTSESTAGSLAVVAGGGLLAALLAGFGLKGLGKAAGLAGGIATGKALEEAGVQPVYVTNAAEISGGGGIKGALAGAGAAIGGTTALAAVAAVAAAGAAGYLGGKGLASAKEKFDVAMTPSQSLDKLQAQQMDRLATALDKLASSPALTKEQQFKLMIENRSRDLKTSTETSRGASW